MEGRAIARPNLVAADRGTSVSLLPSMEGRAIARPNLILKRFVFELLRRPSMEGRAIARPNHLQRLVGGSITKCLQWRAGQLPGRTRILLLGLPR